MDDPGTSHKGGILYSGAGKPPSPLEPLPRHGRPRHFSMNRVRWPWIWWKKESWDSAERDAFASRGQRGKFAFGAILAWTSTRRVHFNYTFQMTLLAPCRILHALCCQRAIAHHVLLPWMPGLRSRCAVCSMRIQFPTGWFQNPAALWLCWSKPTASFQIHLPLDMENLLEASGREPIAEKFVQVAFGACPPLF